MESYQNLTDTFQWHQLCLMSYLKNVIFKIHTSKEESEIEDEALPPKIKKKSIRRNLKLKITSSSAAKMSRLIRDVAP